MSNEQLFNQENEGNSLEKQAIETGTESVDAVTFASENEYVAYIRKTIKDNTPPQAWLSLDMLSEILGGLGVEPYYTQLGYDSLESFLSADKYRMLWRADKQFNSPFLVRHSYGLEIVQYVQAVRDAIHILYLEGGRKSVDLETLMAYLKEQNLPIGYVQMGYPSFEVFIVDKRYSNYWLTEKGNDFRITLRPYLEGRELFLDKTYLSLEKFFSRRGQNPTEERLVTFFKNGIASKLYRRYGYASLQDLAQDPAFAPLLVMKPTSPHLERNIREGYIDARDTKAQEKALAELIEQVNNNYSRMAETENSWVSLTVIASRIPSVKQRVQNLGYSSLSKLIQEHASNEAWRYRYTDSIPPDFQIIWLNNPGKPQEEDIPEDFYSHEALIREIRKQVSQFDDEWVLLAVIGQYVRNLKQRVEYLGYPSLGAFVKENARVAGWQYTYIDDIPAKLSIKLVGDFHEEALQPKSVESQDAMSEFYSTRREVAPAKSEEKRMLLEPGFCLKLQFANQDALEDLARQAVEEPWRSEDGSLDRLKHFLIAQLVRSASQCLLVERDTDQYLFHTGLYTAEGTSLIGVVEKETPEIGAAKIRFVGVESSTQESDEQTPQQATFYEFSAATPLEQYICNPTKPIKPISSISELAEDALEDLQQVVDKAWSLLHRQARLAVACYEATCDQVHMLLPLQIDGGECPYYALQIAWRGSSYEPIALLSYEEAYNKARAVAPLVVASLLVQS